jgi:hemolysin III
MMKIRLPKTDRAQRSGNSDPVPAKGGIRGWFSAPEREQSRGEEIANSISHGVALIAALAGIPFLIIHAATDGDTEFMVGVYLFSATIIILYLSSTLYHALPTGTAKRLFRVIEHCAIFLLIAGSYAPFALGVLRGAWGWTLLGMVWCLALAGVAVEVFGKRTHLLLSTGLYLLMGWLAVIAIDPLFEKVPAPGLLWLFAGGLAYTGGVAFFLTDSRLRYGHLIWHLFVIAGTTCHYFAVLWYAGYTSPT